MPPRIENMPTDAMGRTHLSARQADLLEAIRRLRMERGYSPTIRELCAEVGVTENAVAQQLNMLRRKRWVDWQPGLARTLNIVGDMTEKGGV